jgi:hypothetical protein
LARKETVTLLDDLEDQETPADETVWFGIDGKSYEIDLTFSNAVQFREAMSPYTAAARVVTESRRIRTRSTASRQHSADIRAWAKKHGREIPERGRIPVSIIAEYEASH